jgi:selenocysteine lyase/cysteine desulfurase
MGESTTSLAFRIIDAITRAVPGSNVVTTNLDHPAVYDATRWVAEKYRKEWRVAGLDPTKGVVTPTEIARHIDANTSLLAIIHSSNNLGTTNDVESIAREARKAKPDLYVLVDGSQYIAHFPLDVEALWCDAYITSTYKTFSRVGASFAFLSDRTARLPHERLLGTPETTWELGTRDQSCYAAWSKVVEYLAWLGSRFTSDKGKRETIVAAMKGIEEHERALTHRLLHGTEQDPGLLKTPGVTVYPGSVDLPRRQPVVAMNVAGRSSGQVVKILSDRGIRVTSRQSDYYSRHTLQALGIEECVRVSLAHYNTPEEVDVFLKAMSELPR